MRCSQVIRLMEAAGPALVGMSAHLGDVDVQRAGVQFLTLLFSRGLDAAGVVSGQCLRLPPPPPLP
jgi:hypothetical protein